MLHVRFGHISPKVIQHLPTAVKGIKILGAIYEKHEDHFQEVCIICTIAQLQKIISRRPFLPVSCPYECVHVNLIVMTPPTYNRAKYSLHTCNQYSKYHDLFPMHSKKQVRSALDQLDAKVQRQYNIRIARVHIDGEWNTNQGWE